MSTRKWALTLYLWSFLLLWHPPQFSQFPWVVTRRHCKRLDDDDNAMNWQGRIMQSCSLFCTRLASGGSWNREGMKALKCNVASLLHQLWRRASLCYCRKRKQPNCRLTIHPNGHPGFLLHFQCRIIFKIGEILLKLFTLYKGQLGTFLPHINDSKNLRNG